MITRFRGLSEHQVIKSRSEHGSNQLTPKKGHSFLKVLLTNLADPMIEILIIALIINIIFSLTQNNLLETFGIAFAILLAVFVSTISEVGSEAAFQKLQAKIDAIEVKVRRNGISQIIPVADVVVGDILLLEAGDKITADGLLLEGQIEVDQSTLNGEAKEAVKKVIDASLDQLSDDFLHPQCLFNGTTVSAGEAIMEVKAVGDNTIFGRLAADLQEATPDSPLKEKLRKLARRISIVGYIGAALVFLSYLLQTIVIAQAGDVDKMVAVLTNIHTLLPLIINASTLAVSVIVMSVPEGLPMMITVVLSVNTRRMLKDQVLIRKLSSIDTVGSINILFTDKTGTLTSGKLEVATFIDPTGKMIADPQQINPRLAQLIGISLRDNNSASNGAQIVGGNATDRCLMEYAQLFGALPAVKVEQRIPFTSESKYMASQISGAYHLTLYKGAPEKLLAKCRQVYRPDGSVELLKNRQPLQATIDLLSGKAMRVIALATSDRLSADSLPDLTLIGLIGIRDQMRKEVAKATNLVQNAGIQTVMITGDAKQTALAIAAESGIAEKGDLVLTSEELAQFSDPELKSVLPKLKVVARARPADKLRLVKVAQEEGLVVAMTGDGVNDAPALKRADVGIAMGSGTEITKEAGDIIITDDNFLSIAKAIGYGRTIFKSIRKFVIFQLTINFCAVAVSIIAPLLNVATPITVVQMLWINLVIDTLAGMAFGGERPRVKYMLEEPKKRSEPIINAYMWQQIIVSTIFGTLLSIFFLKVVLGNGLFAVTDPLYGMTAYFTLFMFMAIFSSLNARTQEINLFDYLVLNKQFVWIMASISLIQVFLIYFGGEFFHCTPMRFDHLLVIIILSATVIPLDLTRKAIANKKGANHL